MHLQNYRKTKGKEPIIINLDSDEEMEEEIQIVSKSNLATMIKQEPLEKNNVESGTIKENQTIPVDNGMREVLGEEIVIEYDESSNSYVYQYQCEPKDLNLPLKEVENKQPQATYDVKASKIQEPNPILGLTQQQRKEKSLRLRLKIAEKMAAKRKM